MAKKVTRKTKKHAVNLGADGRPVGPGNPSKDLKKRELTDGENIRLEEHRQRAKGSIPVKFKLDGAKRPEGRVGLTPHDMNDPLFYVKMAEALGTTDKDAQGLLFDQVVQTFAGVAVPGDVNIDRLAPAANQAAALLAGIRPQDELEGMLAVQMIAVHNAAMHTMRQAMAAQHVPEAKRANLNYATKLMQIFANQMETLKKYRTGGQQKMVVEHVHVNEGGQAVVGTVNVGSGPVGKTRDEPHAD